MNEEREYQEVPQQEYPEAACAPAKPKKFEELINASKGLNHVKNNLEALKNKIGIHQKAVECKGEPNKKPPATLLSTLNELPDEIRTKIEGINKLIAEIEEALN